MIFLVIPVNPINVVRGIKPPVCYKDRPGMGILLFEPIYNRAHMDFFRFVSGEKVVCERNSIAVHQQSHFDNRIGAMVLLRSAFPIFCRSFFPVPIYRSAILIQQVNIRTSNIKVIIRSVEIGNRKVPFAKLLRMVKDPFLEGLLVFGNEVERIVDVIQRKPFKVFKKNTAAIKSLFLGTGI